MNASDIYLQLCADFGVCYYASHFHLLLTYILSTKLGKLTCFLINSPAIEFCVICDVTHAFYSLCELSVKFDPF